MALHLKPLVIVVVTPPVPLHSASILCRKQQLLSLTGLKSLLKAAQPDLLPTRCLWQQVGF